jgi:iron complex outermembrane receptor protein
MSFPRYSTALSAVTLGLFSIDILAAVHMPVIVVTPSAFEQARGEANSAVTVIDRQAIEQANAGSVAEILRGHAGLHVRDLFGDGREAVVDLRGFGAAASSNTLVLVDGRRLNNSADQAAPDLSLISLDNIERIEIFQGSAGVLYGNQAVGGVINIITRTVSRNEARFSVRGGSYASVQARASVDRLLGQTQLSVALSDQQSDNYRDHNESNNRRARIRATRQHAGFSAFVELEKNTDDIQTPGALLANELALNRSQSLPVYSQDYFATDTNLLRLGLDKHMDDEHTLAFDFSSRDTERDFIQSFRPFPGSLTTQARETRLLSFDWRYQPTGRHLRSLVVGADIDDTDYSLVSIIGPQAMQQTVQDVFVASQWRLNDSADLDIGLRHSRRDADIGAQPFNDSVTVAGLGYTWKQDGLRLFARADQNFRYPTVEEHTSPPFGQPPGLRTQQGLSLELGVEWLSVDQRYRASLYNIRLDDEIGFDSSGFANLNIDRSERHGLILEASRHWTPAWQTALSLTLIDAEITGGPFSGGDLPLAPARSLRLDVNWSVSARVKTGLEWLGVSEQVFGGDFANQLGRLPSWQVLNAHLSYNLKAWSMKLRINNLLNEKYSETGSQFTEFDPVTFAPTNHQAFFPSPERNAWLSLEYRFD